MLGHLLSVFRGSMSGCLVPVLGFTVVKMHLEIRLIAVIHTDIISVRKIYMIKEKVVDFVFHFVLLL